uniref:RibD family protein n=1 Tax=Cyanobium sp. TaxID=2164130 RepID=UPI00404746DC
MTPPQLRLVLAVSLDGRLAPAEGGAAQLGGPGDRRVLEEALAWADGCLIGAETLRLHGSTCLIHAPDLLEQRHLAARPPQPAALVVSRSGQIPGQLPFFQQPIDRWLLAPVSAAPVPGQAPGFQRHVPLEPWPRLLSGLAAEGLERLLVLGGAQLAACLLREALIDELQLTLCPQVLGGPHSWVPLQEACPGSHWRLQETRHLGGDELMLRYARQAP